LGARVELLAEAHDVHAALAEGRPDRRRRRGGTGLHLQFDIAQNLLGHGFSSMVRGLTGLSRGAGSAWPPLPRILPQSEIRGFRSKEFKMGHFLFAEPESTSAENALPRMGMGYALVRRSGDLLDLAVLELDRRGASEDGHRHAQAGAFLVDLF